MVPGDMDETSLRHQRGYLLPVEILSCWYLKRQNVRQPEKEMVGATGFEIAFCLFLDFGLVRHLAE
jgi:hypothetical protein